MINSGTSKGTAAIPQRPGRQVLLNTGAMAGSSLWRILVSFILQVVVTRALGFEALGQYTVALAYLNVSQVIAEMGFQSLLVREVAQHASERRSYFVTALCLQLVASFLVWLGLWILVSLLHYSSIMSTLILIVGATLPFYAATSACQTMFQGCERMELVMMVELTINTLIGIFSITILYLGGSIIQLVLVLVLTQAISAGYCLYLLWHHQLLSGAFHRSTATQPLRLLRQAIPFYALSLADVLLQRLDILLLSVIGGELLTGIYSVAYNVVRVLLKLIQSFWKALYPTLSRLYRHRPERYRQLAHMGLHYGLILLLLAASIGIGAADAILTLVYGEPSGESINAFKVLVWSTPLFLVELYAMTLLMVENRTGYSLRIMVIHLATVALLLPPLSASFGTLGAAWAVLMASLTGTGVSVVVMRRFKMPDSLPQNPWLALPAGVATPLMLYLPASWPLRVACGTVMYLLLLVLCGIVTRHNLITLRTILLRQEE